MTDRDARTRWRNTLWALLLAACGQHSSRQTAGEPDAHPPADASAAVLEPQTGTVIQLQPGIVEGKLVGSTREFLGIPYAQPPLGKLRFAPPQPIAAWSPIRAAIAFGPACPQPQGPLSSPTPSDEDCLYMNVYTPVAIDRALPVMVFIHGGAFMRGSADTFQGRWLSEAGPVVLVTFNYRLGPLGFLSHPALDAERGSLASGNDGIRDQQLALQFVHDNIAALGGDPANITVFGESAGSVSACVHFVSPGSRTIAKRFIMESGACVGGGYGVVTHQDAQALGAQLGDALCPGASDLPACLRQQPIDALVQWQNNQTVFGANWHPSIDGPGGVLPDTPEQLIADPAFTPRAALIGTNEDEWGLFEFVGLLQGLDRSLILSKAALSAAIDQEFGAGASQVREQYSADSDAQAADVYTRLLTDLEFRCPTRTLARLASAEHSVIYLYNFDAGSAIHAAELPYVAGSDPASATPATAPLTQAMQAYWTQFATRGDPNADGLPSWPPYRTVSDQHMTLSDPPYAANGLAKSDCDFWEQYRRDGGTIDLGF
jgi:para-nitrobenzyl esterase